MEGTFAKVDIALDRLSQLAARLGDGESFKHVCRSVEELRTAFATHAPVEPAVGRLLRSLEMTNAEADGLRREFLLNAPRLDRLESALEAELLPALRQIGFEV